VSFPRPDGELHRKSNGRIGKDAGDRRAKLRSTEKTEGMYEHEPAISGRPFSRGLRETVGANPVRFFRAVAPLRSDRFPVVRRCVLDTTLSAGYGTSQSIMGSFSSTTETKNGVVGTPGVTTGRHTPLPQRFGFRATVCIRSFHYLSTYALDCVFVLSTFLATTRYIVRSHLPPSLCVRLTLCVRSFHALVDSTPFFFRCV